MFEATRDSQAIPFILFGRKIFPTSLRSKAATMWRRGSRALTI